MQNNGSTLTIRAPEDFDFLRTVRAHGWYALPPFAYDPRRQALSGVTSIGDQAVRWEVDEHHGLLRLLGGHAFADFHGQVAEYGAGLGSLQAFYADVLDDERTEGLRSNRQRQGEQHEAEGRGNEGAHRSAGKQTIQIVVEGEGHHDQQ